MMYVKTNQPLQVNTTLHYDFSPDTVKELTLSEFDRMSLAERNILYEKFPDDYKRLSGSKERQSLGRFSHGI